MTRRLVLTTLLPGFVGLELPGWLRELLADGLGGVCLFGENIQSTAQLRRLTDAIRAANPEAIIAIDEEGGDVTRLYYDRGAPFPGNAVLGRLDDVSVTTAVAQRVGEELRAVGVNLDLAPDVDINSNPDNPVIGVRSFGAGAELVSRHSAAWTRGLQSAGVAASIKHFPGHGDTAQDSHLALPVVVRDRAGLEERELAPFRAAIGAGAATVMTSHILLPLIDADNPATFSETILGSILRDSLGFEGVVVSDALDMAGASAETGIPAAAVRALAAGCDLLCIGTDNSAAEIESIVAEIEAAMREETLSSARLADAARRIVSLARSMPAPSEYMAPTEYDVLPGLDSVSGAFETSPAAAGVLDRLVDPVLVRVETVANIAIGQSPWGPFAAGYRGEVVTATEDDHAHALSLDSGRDIVLVGKDNHRRRWVRDLADGLRLRHRTVLVVDMGWPDAGREYADLSTFGASRLVGHALLGVLPTVVVSEEQLS